MIAKRLLALAAASMLALAACSTTEANPEDKCADADFLCVGLVTDTGKVDDKSFNQSAHEGAKAAAEEAGGYYKYIETIDSKDYANNIKQFTDKKYDVIVTVGFLMADATLAAAKEYTETHFIGVDQFPAETLDNLTGLLFPEDQAGYAAGYLAGKMTQTNKLGQVLGLEIAPVQKFALGFEAGAKAANDAVSVTTVYHPPADNGFNDPEWGAAEAAKQIAQGVDIIFGAGGNTGNGALLEIAKTEGAGESLFCIGVDTDQWNTVPQAQPCLITSAMKMLTEGTKELVLAVNDGTIEGGIFSGDIGLADYHDFSTVIPEDVQAEVADVIARLIDGSLETGVVLP